MAIITQVIFWGFVIPFYTFVDTGRKPRFDDKLSATKLTCKQKIRYLIPTQDLTKIEDPQKEMARKLFFGVVENFVRMIMGKLKNI